MTPPIKEYDMTLLFTSDALSGFLESVPCSMFVKTGVIYEGWEACSTSFITSGFPMLEFLRVLWMKEWLMPEILELESFKMMFAMVFHSLNRCRIS